MEAKRKQQGRAAPFGSEGATEARPSHLVSAQRAPTSEQASEPRRDGNGAGHDEARNPGTPLRELAISSVTPSEK